MRLQRPTEKRHCSWNKRKYFKCKITNTVRRTSFRLQWISRKLIVTGKNVLMPAYFTLLVLIVFCIVFRGESHIDFRTQCVIMTQITWPPTPYYMRHFQIFGKINNFLENVPNVLDSKGEVANSLQSEVANSQLDPKSIHYKSLWSKLHFYFLIGFESTWNINNIKK